jgi:hypothetical protein
VGTVRIHGDKDKEGILPKVENENGNKKHSK